MDLKDKIVLVTGASGGIGSAVARAFSAESAKLILHSHLQPVPVDGFSVYADFRDNGKIEAMFSLILKEFGGLDILVNAVGIEEAAPDQLDTDKWTSMIQVNLLAAAECVRYALPLMEKRHGAIINVSSVMGNRGIVGEESLGYAVTKAGLQKLSENLALMLAPKSIRVVGISPGYTRTPIWNSFGEDQKNRAIGAVPIGRFISPEEIAQFVVAVARNDAITGVNLDIGGGLGLKSII